MFIRLRNLCPHILQHHLLQHARRPFISRITPGFEISPALMKLIYVAEADPARFPRRKWQNQETAKLEYDKECKKDDRLGTLAVFVQMQPR